MFNDQFVRLTSAVIESLWDQGFPDKTADHVFNAMVEAEITFDVEETRNRLRCEARRILRCVRERGRGYRPDPRD